MLTVIPRFCFILFAATLLFSCRKGATVNRQLCTVSANKMIDLGSKDWTYGEAELSNMFGYQYKAASPSIPIKATVKLIAVDDSNRTVTGSILLNVALDNTVSHAAFDTEAVPKETAYAMMLQYNKEALQTLTPLTSSIGGFVQNNMGGNTNVDVIVSKLTNLEEANQLSITYNSGRRKMTIVVFRQNDGLYIFSCRG